MYLLSLTQSDDDVDPVEAVYSPALQGRQVWEPSESV